MTQTVADSLIALGPFFAVDTHARGSVARGPWRPMSELVDDPEVLVARVRAVRDALAAAGGLEPDAVELRVAASVAHLGLVARLVSPALAVAVLHGRPPELDLGQLQWQPTLGGPFPLSIPLDPDGPHPGGVDDVNDLALRLAEHVVDGPVRALVEATASLSVSPAVLWGNVTSAVNGATTMIAATRPAAEIRIRRLASALLDLPPLRGRSLGRPGDGFRRLSCCLIYRAAPGRTGRLCGDCVLGAGRPVQPSVGLR